MQSSRFAAQVSDAVTAAEVPDTAVGLLIVDGRLAKVLEPGLHAFWKYHRALKIELVDRRVQAMEVAGQEILTRDKVSLRVNLTALWQVPDAVKARGALTNFVEFVYKELQFALREAVGARVLDELLGDKGVLDREIGNAVRAKVEELGLAVRSVGVKDIILPGEMKTILNQVVEAEKVAQANLVKRREETAATRSLLNTRATHGREPDAASRLKELETLEKVTEKIDKLTVFGGPGWRAEGRGAYPGAGLKGHARPQCPACEGMIGCAPGLSGPGGLPCADTKNFGAAVGNALRTGVLGAPTVGDCSNEKGQCRHRSLIVSALAPLLLVASSSQAADKPAAQRRADCVDRAGAGWCVARSTRRMPRSCFG